MGSDSNNGVRHQRALSPRLSMMMMIKRPSCVWFDDECRRAKQARRSTERSARRVGPLPDISSSTVVARSTSSWTERINAQQAYHPCRLWRSFNQLLGRCRAPLSADASPSDWHCYFDDKVAGVRASTSGADHQPSRQLPSALCYEFLPRSH